MVDVFDPQHVFVESLRSAGHHDLAADYAGLIRRGVLFSSAPTVFDHAGTLTRGNDRSRPSFYGRPMSPRQRRTNVWRKVTSPAWRAKATKKRTTTFNRGIVRKVKRGLYRWHG